MFHENKLILHFEILWLRYTQVLKIRCVWFMDTGNTALYLCMAHGYWQYCTVRVYDTWILAILHCTCVWHMDTGNTALCVWHMDIGNTELYVCMTHGYWQYCTVSVYGTWILAIVHCKCVWHMDTGNTALYVCMTHGYWQYWTVRVYDTWILAILH